MNVHGNQSRHVSSWSSGHCFGRESQSHRGEVPVNDECEIDHESRSHRDEALGNDECGIGHENQSHHAWDP